MNCSRFRVLTLLATLLLVMPLVATTALVSAQNAATPVAEVSAPPLADAMPATVQAYVASDFNLENDQFTQATGLLTSLLVPGAGDTVSAIVEKLIGILDLLPSNVRTVLEGEIGIGITGFHPLDLNAVTDSSSGMQSVLPGYAVVLHPNQAGRARQEVEDWFTAQLDAKGLEPERDTERGVVILTNPGASDPATATTPSVVVFVGDYILLGHDLDDMQPFISAIRGGVPTLSESANLDKLNSALPNDRLLFGFISGETMTESAASIFNDSSLAASIEPPFGETAFTIAADDPGFRFESVSLPVQGTTLPDVDAGSNPDFASTIPSTTLAMFAGEDLGNSWLMAQLQKVILSVLMSSLGAGEIDLTDTDLDTQFGVLSMLTGIDFKKDLMDQLVGDYGAALLSLDTENPWASSAVIASELDQVDRVSIGVTSLGPLLQTAGSGDISITTASVNGQTVNNVTLVNDDQTATIQYGVVDDKLMVGLGDGVANVAHGQITSLDENPGYQAGLAQLPARYTSVMYADVQALGEQLAPYLIDQFAVDSNNSIAKCLVKNMVRDGSPVPEIHIEGLAGTACSLIGTILGNNWLQDFVVSRLPGPLTAVAYQQDDMQHISGILLVGENS